MGNYHLEHPQGQNNEQEIEEAAVDVLKSIKNNLETKVSLEALTQYGHIELAKKAAARVLETIEDNSDARSSLEKLTQYGHIELAKERYVRKFRAHNFVFYKEPGVSPPMSNI